MKVVYDPYITAPVRLKMGPINESVPELRSVVVTRITPEKAIKIDAILVMENPSIRKRKLNRKVKNELVELKMVFEDTLVYERE
jgi:hypothetical protein